MEPNAEQAIMSGTSQLTQCLIETEWPKSNWPDETVQEIQTWYHRSAGSATIHRTNKPSGYENEELVRETMPTIGHAAFPFDDLVTIQITS